MTKTAKYKVVQYQAPIDGVVSRDRVDFLENVEIPVNLPGSYYERDIMTYLYKRDWAHRAGYVDKKRHIIYLFKITNLGA